MAKTPIQEIDGNLKKNLADKIKGQKVKVTCVECDAGLGSWTISGLGTSKTFVCKKCQTKTDVDTSDIREILNEISRL